MADFTSKKKVPKMGTRYTAYDLTPMLNEDLMEIHRIRLDTHAGRGSIGIFHM